MEELSEQDKFVYWVARVVRAAVDEAVVSNADRPAPTQEERQIMQSVQLYLANPSPPTDRSQALFAGIVLALSTEF